MNTPKQAILPKENKKLSTDAMRKGKHRIFEATHNQHAQDVVIKTISRKHAARHEREEDFKALPLTTSFQDWLLGLLEDPHNLKRVRERIEQSVRDFPSFINQVERAVKDVPLGPIKADYRYQDELWKDWPFNIYSQSF